MDDAYNSENSNTRFYVAGSSDTDRVSVRTAPAEGVPEAPVGVSDGESYGLGAVLRTGADRTRRKMVTDEAYAGLLRPARCFDNPVGRRYNLQMASAGSDPEDKQNESGYYSACSSAYPCGRGRICSEPDGGAYGGAGHDHVHDGFVV